jgi:HK97 family phage prohead protease
METTYVPLEDMEIRTAEDGHYIEGICVPYGRRTDRVAVPEVFDRGAFRELVTANAKVKLTDYNHSRDRVPVGYSRHFEERTEGLFGRFRLNNTPEGRSAHENSIEGVYGGLSIGFIARADRMQEGVRHVTAARLDHVSLVEVPAYQDAVITALRGVLDAELAEWRALANRSLPAIDTRDRTSQNLLMASIRRRAN